MKPFCAEISLGQNGFIRLFLYTPLDDIANFELAEKERIHCVCPHYVLQICEHREHIENFCFYQKTDGFYYRAQHHQAFTMKSSNWDCPTSCEQFVEIMRKTLSRFQDGEHFLMKTLDTYALFHQMNDTLIKGAVKTRTKI